MELSEPMKMLYCQNFKQENLHCIIYLLMKFDHFSERAKGGKMLRMISTKYDE